ncbi:adenosine 3'-phospho 5'-phosphosulfate transporter 2 [Nilaparvata lugens]|uniref:adenosine 3'-phospho 5'-phosphosulfate transporter 2 n=1 Tax=Nilaparvata lugens TaxID=108931 RepID=UPI00193E3AAB|nr:adenosine 3'-phospho 5'-phosphosulfate transporter 2 [Nilaparvata lugens]
MEVKIHVDDKSRLIDSRTNTEVKILFYDISGYSSYKQVVICSIGVFLFYIIYGYLQELIFTLHGSHAFGWYLTLVQFAFYSIFGFIELALQGKTGERQVSLKVYSLWAFLSLGTMGFSNTSLEHLNYPTQVMFKSCKLIPVMIGSIIILKKKYTVIDYSAVLLMCLGLTLFTLADSRLSPRFSVVGVVMISCALLCDAVIGNVQEKVFKAQSPPMSEVVLYSYSIGFFILLTVMTVSGSLVRGILVVPNVFYLYASLFSLSGYLGLQIVLTLVKTSGALSAVTITTCRKAVSILLSFIFFAKPFTFQYLWGGSLIVIAIYLNVLSKSNKELIRYLQHMPQQILSHMRPLSRERKNILATVPLSNCEAQEVV